MAHFAEIDSDNIVQRVVVISNDDLLDNNGQDLLSWVYISTGAE